MSNKYILDGKKVVLCEDLTKWAARFENTDRKVARTEVDAKVSVSTVFIGLDHSFGEGPPLLFETLVFGGSLDGEMDRYSTWEEAEVGHKEMVEKAKTES